MIFSHVNTLTNLLDICCWKSIIFTAKPFFLMYTCYNGPTFILTAYGGNA